MLKFLHRRLGATFLCLFVGVLPLATRAKPTALAAADLTTLQRYRTDYANGLSSGNAALLAVASSENLRLMTESQPTVFGAANVAAYYRALLGRFAVSDYARREIEVRDLGSRVIEFGHFREKLTLKSGGQTFELNGKYLDAWEKRADGGLQLAVTAWNYDARLPDGEAMRFPEVPSTRTAFLGRAPIDTDVSFELAARCRLLETAIVEHDAGLWSRFYTEDAVILANNDAVYVGRKAVETYIAAHCPQLPIFEKLDIRNDRIEDLGEYVFEYASHVASWRNGDSSGVATGKDLRIWRRERSGVLKLAVQIGAYD